MVLQRVFDNYFLSQYPYASSVVKDNSVDILMPGVKKENIQILRDGNSLNITWKNRFGVDCSDMYSVPSNTIDIKAKLSDGLLNITFVKNSPQKIDIE